MIQLAWKCQESAKRLTSSAFDKTLLIKNDVQKDVRVIKTLPDCSFSRAESTVIDVRFDPLGGGVAAEPGNGNQFQVLFDNVELTRGMSSFLEC